MTTPMEGPAPQGLVTIPREVWKKLIRGDTVSLDVLADDMTHVCCLLRLEDMGFDVMNQDVMEAFTEWVRDVPDHISKVRD